VKKRKREGGYRSNKPYREIKITPNVISTELAKIFLVTFSFRKVAAITVENNGVVADSGTTTTAAAIFKP
jgi:hypothetical protein